MRARAEDDTRGDMGQARALEPESVTRLPFKDPPVHLITLVQIAVLVVVFLMTRATDPIAAKSLMAGGLVAIVPHAWFAFRLFRGRSARSARAIAQTGYAAETAKFLLSAVGFAMVFSMLRPINGAAVFAGFLLMLPIQIGGSVLLLRRSATTENKQRP